MPYSKKIAGIYKIVNIKNNKIYIGSSVHVINRFNAHKNLLNKNKHFNSHLQSAWNKYGECNFVFELIEELVKDDLVKKEEYYIILYNANNPKFGYNKRIECTSNLGRKYTDEQKQKLSKAHLGHKRSVEAHNKIIQSQYKKVCQIDLNGNMITVFNSMKEASEITGVWHTSISGCCRKVLNTGQGFYWCYFEDLETFVIPTDKRKK